MLADHEYLISDDHDELLDHRYLSSNVRDGLHDHIVLGHIPDSCRGGCLMVAQVCGITLTCGSTL